MATPTIPNGRTQFFSTIYEGNGSGRRAGKLVPFEDDATIANSCVFDHTTNAYLSRTPSSGGSTTKATFSCWIKRAPESLGSTTYIMLTNDFSANGEVLQFDSSNRLQYYCLASSSYRWNYVSNRRFEGVNKYYHIYVRRDTTDGTAGDRIQIYVDGQRITSWSTETQSGSSSAGFWNQTTYANVVGNSGNGSYIDGAGYLAEVNMVDGTNPAVSTFGVTNTTTGRWIPKTLTGITYGTNGFRLQFGTNSALGDDTSGNTNDLASTGLATTDQTLDSPTNNHACWDPNRNGGFTLSEGGRGFTLGSGWRSLGMSMQLNTGKWYWEFKCTALSSNSGGFLFGFAKPAAYSSVLSSYVGGISNTVSIQLGGSSGGGANYRYVNGSYSDSNMSSNGFSSGGFVQIAYDADAGKIWIGVNNTWVDDANGNTGNPATGANALFTDFQAGSSNWANFFVSLSTSVGSGFMNWGQTAFNYTAPTGFLAVKQDNFSDLPTGVGIPDFTWIKDRDSTNNNYMVDTSRGLNKYLISNTDGAESTEENGVVKMLNGGFELSDAAITNTQNNSFVGWSWAGNSGSTSTNTEGSITSTVQANTTAGFSIVQFNGTSSDGSVGHGLSQAPEWIMVKILDVASVAGFTVSTTADPNGFNNFLYLNETEVSRAYNNWQNTAPTNSVFTVTTAGTANQNGQKMLAYCWHSVDGFSKFGRYTGNGSADGPFIYTGFKPTFVMVKRTDSAYDWQIWDTKRSPINPSTNQALFPNGTTAEGGTSTLDILSNGFKWRSNGAWLNASGGTYIYMAFAEHPFVGDGTNPVTAR